MGVVTGRPDSTTYSGINWTLTGGTAHAVLADESDATYADAPAQAPDSWRGLRVSLANVVIPPGAKVKGVRFRMRAKDRTAFAFWDSQGRAIPYLNGSVGNGVASAWGQTAATDYSGGYETSNPNGLPWSVADVNALEALLTSYTDNFGTGIRFYWVAYDVEYNEAPVVSSVSVDAPINVSRPTVSWVMTDAEGDPQQDYELAVSTSSANPDSVAPMWRSGRTAGGQVRSLVVGTDLTSGTYYAHVRVWQAAVSGQEHYSAWTTQSFTVSITPPATPGLTATADSANARVILAYTKNNGDAGTTLTIEVSDDGGVTWAPHPNITAMAISGNGTTYDYESPPRGVRRYRAKVTVGAVRSSAYSLAVLAQVSSGKWQLKDPLVPSLNVSPDVVEFSKTFKEPQAVYEPLGRSEAVVITEGMKGMSGTITFRTKDTAARLAMEAITQTGRVLLLQDIFGGQWYIKLGASHNWKHIRATDPTGTYPVRDLWEASFPYEKVARQVT
jgi:hypothetical protein